MRATAWILDVAHQARRLACDIPPGRRCLPVVEEALRVELGLTPGCPVGMWDVDGSPELLFVSPTRGTGEGWAPLSAWAQADDRGFHHYVEAMLGGWIPPTRDLHAFYFGDAPALAAKLAHLVARGGKRGTTGSVEASMLDGSGIPEVGTVSIVTDGFGYPVCAIRTEAIERLRYADIDATHALDEGEGDRTLEGWRDIHDRFFRAEATSLGITFSEETMVFFERFRVLTVFGGADR